MKEVRINADIPESLKIAVDIAAAKTRMTIKEIVTESLRDWLKKNNVQETEEAKISLALAV